MKSLSRPVFLLAALMAASLPAPLAAADGAASVAGAEFTQGMPLYAFLTESGDVPERSDEDQALARESADAASPEGRSAIRLDLPQHHETGTLAVVPAPRWKPAAASGYTAHASEDARREDEFAFRDMVPYTGVAYHGHLFSGIYLSLDGGLRLLGDPPVQVASDPNALYTQEQLDQARTSSGEMLELEIFPLVNFRLRYRF